MAVLLVEHDMDLLMKVCDTVTVLDAGTVIADGHARRGPNAILRSGLRTSVTRNRSRDRPTPPGDQVPAPAGPIRSGAATADLRPVLELKGVHAAYGRIEVLHGVDLSIPAGRYSFFSARTAQASRRS